MFGRNQQWKTFAWKTIFSHASSCSMVLIADLNFLSDNSNTGVILNLASVDYLKCEKLKIFNTYMSGYFGLYLRHFNIMLYDSRS